MQTVSKAADGSWAVTDDGQVVKGGFPDSASAWKWLDRQERTAIADENQRRRVRYNFVRKMD